jgi:type II secretory pathway pseudopilin PulG
LIEALIVLALTAVVLALALSGRSLLDNRRLTGAARDLGTDVRFVEQRARAERSCWRIRFLPANDRYVIESHAAGTWTPGGGCAGGTWTTYRAAAMPARIDLVNTTFGGDLLTASPYGNPNGGTVVLQSAGGEQRRVTVNVGGRVVISR